MGDGPELADLVVISYNTSEYLQSCLESIRACTGVPYRLIVVDNASKDGSTAYLRSLPGITLIINEFNLGYARACNQGILAGRAPYVILMNSDVKVTPGWLEPMLECAGRDSRIAVVGNKHLDRRGRLVGAGVVGSYQEPVWRGWGLPNGPGVFDREEDVLSVSGACFLIKRELIPTLGLLDERYFFYFEETDYCYTARTKGYRVVYCPESTIYHYLEGSPADKISRSRYYGRAERLFREKWAYLFRGGAK